MLEGMRTTSRTPKPQSRSRSAIQIAAITAGMPDATSGEGSTVTIASDDPSVIAIRICDDRRNTGKRAKNNRAMRAAAIVNATTNSRCSPGPRASRLCADMNPGT